MVYEHDELIPSGLIDFVLMLDALCGPEGCVRWLVKGFIVGFLVLGRVVLKTLTLPSK